MSIDSINKFNKMQNDYSKYRPNYSNEAIEYILSLQSINDDFTIADIGAGTGKLSLPFVKRGLKLYGIEPNKDMYEKLLENMKEYSNFSGILGYSENTYLDNKSIDLIVVGQAFHWFNVDEFKEECRRILKNENCYIAILYNNGDYTKDVINKIHELSREYCPEYRGSSGGLYNNEDIFNNFFDNGYARIVFKNDYKLTLDQFIGLNFSASYAPKENEENHDIYLSKLEEVFNTYQEDGCLTMPNNTILRIGKI